jgi:hypothetical protein
MAGDLASTACAWSQHQHLLFVCERAAVKGKRFGMLVMLCSAQLARRLQRMLVGITFSCMLALAVPVQCFALAPVV